MAYPKRLVPVTDEERKERNRRYQQTRREKTNNNYARAYRRAMQRAAEWFQENRADTWRAWLEQELEIVNDTPYVPANRCRHDGERFAMGVGVGCSLCGSAIGVSSVDEDLRIQLTDTLGLRDPVVELRVRKGKPTSQSSPVSPYTKVKR